MADAVNVCPEGWPRECGSAPEIGNVVLGGTAGAGDDGTPPFSGLLDRGAEAALFGPELFGGWFTCSRFLRVTSSVLRLLRRCWRCTASFEDEASETKTFARIVSILLIYG